MSSIRVHQDLFNYERRRLGGFTARQLAGTAVAAACLAAAFAVVSYLLPVPPYMAVTIAMPAALPGLAAGWVPVAGMPATEAAGRWLDIEERGPVVVWAGEEVPNLEDGPEARALAATNPAKTYRRKVSRRGRECSPETVESVREERTRERDRKKRCRGRKGDEGRGGGEAL